jgi:RNA polymerase sigma-70 factor (ECF subfamily)
VIAVREHIEAEWHNNWNRMMSSSTGYTLAEKTKSQTDRRNYDNITAMNAATLHTATMRNNQQEREVETGGKTHSVDATTNPIVSHQGGGLIDNTALQQQNNKSTDWQLVERVQRGEKKAFDLLVLKYQGKVASLISRYVSDRHEVLDVTQESFIKAYRALNSFRGESAFYTWLYRISINTAKNYLVAKGRRPPGVDIDVQDAEHFVGENGLKDIQSPERNLFRTELEVALNKAITELPEDLRVALTLREFDGLSYDEIAQVMSCPVGTVRSRIFRARDAIDLKLAPYLEGHQR